MTRQSIFFFYTDSLLLQRAITIQSTSISYHTNTYTITTTTTTTTGMPLYITPIVNSWYPLEICKALLIDVSKNSNQNMSGGSERMLLSQLEILYSALNTTTSVTTTTEAPLSGVWLDIYNTLKDYIFVAICDETTTDVACQILLLYTLYSTIGEEILLEGKSSVV